MARHFASAVVVIGCLLAVTACGSSSVPAQTSASAQPRGIAFADCMRSHGVPNFPDPGAGGGIQISPGSGLNPFSPAFKAAQAQCGILLPGGGPGAHRQPSAQAKAEMLAMSVCMRAHGVSGFPDPTLSPPSNPAADSIAIGRGGVFLAVPKTINVGSPVFQQAASICRFGGFGGGRAHPVTPG